MGFRDDNEALRSMCQALERDVEALREERDALARRVHTVDEEVSQLRRRLRVRRALVMIFGRRSPR